MGKYSDKYQPYYQNKKHKEWRKQVMMRDDYLCQHCKASGRIRAAKQAHHIKPIETHWELRDDINNGIALCHQCHDEVHERKSELQKFMMEWEK